MKTKLARRGIGTRFPRLAALLVGLALPQAFADPLPDRASGFDLDAEGWQSAGGGAIAWQSSGGNPAGFLRGSSPNSTWHFASPPAWAGNWQHYKLVKFDLAIVNRQYADAPRNDILVIRGANGTDLVWSGFSPEFNWTHYEVPLVPAAFGVGQAAFDAVMQDVTELRILGEYTTASEQTGLDNVALTSELPPPLSNALVSTFATGTEGWRPVDDVTLVHYTDHYAGNTGGKLRGNDWADGRMYWFASPLAWAGDWSAFRKLSFLLTITGGTGDITGANVRIIGANGQQLFTDLGIPPTGTWKLYSLDLTPAAFGVDQAHFDAVMAHVVELRIRGEYINGGESELLDNVFVHDGNLRFPLVQQDLVGNFDADAEGWSTYQGTAAWIASGGNPGGFLRGEDGGGGIWYFVSPDAWAGDWSLLKRLRFQRKFLSGVYGGGSIDSVHIRAFDGSELVASTTLHAGAWTPQALDLTPATFGVDLATFQNVIRQVEKLWIRGESTDSGYDQSGLDNVAATLSDAPVVPPDRLTDFETGIEGWRRSSNGVSMSWQSSGGNPGGYLKGADDGSDVWGFASPEAWCGDWRFYQTLAFDYRIVSGSYSFGAPEFVMIHGSNGQTLRAGIPNPGNAWATYQVPLTAASFNTDAATFDAVMKDVVQVILYAETVSGYDEEAIDNVRLLKATGSYDAWKTLWWPGPERFDDAISGLDADPDHDGLPNGVECLTGGNPLAFSADQRPQATAGSGAFVFEFPRDDAAEGLGLVATVEAGGDLLDWPAAYLVGPTSAASSPGVEVIENDAAPDTIRVTIPHAGLARYARLKVVQAAP